jgi:AraC-like DNA-binding protein
MALGYVTAGRGLFELGDRYAVSAGDVCLVPAGSAHRMLPDDSTSSWGIGFCATCLGPTEFRELLAPLEQAALGASPVVTIPAYRQEHLHRLCEELHRETGDSGDLPRGGALAQRSLLALILTEVLRATALTAQAAPPTLVGEALRFVERNCLRPLTLADVAAAVHRSPSNVATAVKAATGKTVVSWIVAGRLAEARNRLLHTDGSIAAIAAHVGYADTTHFIRMFRKMHDCTPAVWRERARPFATASKCPRARRRGPAPG